MTPLQNEQRSQGGLKRAENQSPETRRFQALLAASSRPLKHDADLSPEQLLKQFRELQKAHKWLLIGIVGADRRVVLHILSDAEVLRRVKQLDPIGFIGVIFLGTRLQIYGKPLKQGNRVLDVLNRVGEEWRDRVIAQVQKTALPLAE